MAESVSYVPPFPPQRQYDIAWHMNDRFMSLPQSHEHEANQSKLAHFYKQFSEEEWVLFILYLLEKTSLDDDEFKVFLDDQKKTLEFIKALMAEKDTLPNLSHAVSFLKTTGVDF